jgi:serine/threonine-protein kinase RsbW
LKIKSPPLTTWKAFVKPLQRGLGLGGQFDMLLANDVQEVARVIDRIELFCDEESIMPQKGLRFSLALDELITNILSYGLADRTDGQISLTVDHSDGMLHAKIADNGPQFDPFAAEVHAPTGTIEERKVGGLGIALVKSVMDHLEYRREGGFNRLKLSMKL